MALRLQKRTWINQDGSTTENWRLIVEDHTSGTRVCRYPRRDEYIRYGLDPDAKYDRAKEQLKRVRAANELERNLVRRSKISSRLKLEALKENVFLPASLYVGFLTWLQDRRLWDGIPPKVESHLRCMRKLILDLEIDPSEWPNQPEKIFRWFRGQKLSLSTIEKVLPLLNDYGYFYCREYKKPFLPVAAPRGEVARRIEDTNLDSRGVDAHESSPLTPRLLEKLKVLPEEQYRWVRYSLYFGLRPSEVDALTQKNRDKTWKVTVDKGRIPILHLYQTKLTKIARDRRWKRIPAILPEQVRALDEIKRGEQTKRPYPKIIQKHLGQGFGTYMGRKGFEKLMREHGQKNENISRWFGHQDVRTTERNYRETEAVEYDLIES